MSTSFNPAACPSPCYVVDMGLLRRNLEILASVKARSGASILLALKAFAMFATFPLIREYLDGVCASGLNEALLGHREFGREVHTYSPAFVEGEIDEILTISDHVTFNSVAQWRRFGARALAANVSCGLRVNPECSVADVPLYDPCAPGSRLGIRRSQLEISELAGISGLHLHVLCEQDSQALERVLAALEIRFGDILPKMQWLNLGGGHHITRPSYDLEHLADLIMGLRRRYDLDVYLEPGEAVALDTGILVSQVVDIVENDGSVAILDISATCHMPDILEMPYRPAICGAGLPGKKPYTYRLGGNSCLAGDVIGSYSFDTPLQRGQRLVFQDMAHYTMVKTTMFNGVPHPSIATWDPQNQEFSLIRTFTYEDYRNRLS